MGEGMTARPTWFSGSPWSLGQAFRRWSGVGCSWWAADSGEQGGPAVLPGPALRQVQGQASGGGRDARRDGDQRAADGGAGRFAEPATGEGTGRSREVERHHRADQPGAVRAELVCRKAHYLTNVMAQQVGFYVIQKHRQYVRPFVAETTRGVAT
jgi:hypothetical protein